MRVYLFNQSDEPIPPREGVELQHLPAAREGLYIYGKSYTVISRVFYINNDGTQEVYLTLI